MPIFSGLEFSGMGDKGDQSLARYAYLNHRSVRYSEHKQKFLNARDLAKAAKNINSNLSSSLSWAVRDFVMTD